MRLLIAFLLATLCTLGADPRRTVAIVGPEASTVRSPHRIVVIRTAGAVRFPPAGKAYVDDAASHNAWRRIHVVAPDLVLFAGQDAQSIPGIPSQKFDGSVPRRVVQSAAGGDLRKR